MDPISAMGSSFVTGFLGNMLSGEKQMAAINSRVAKTNAEAANKVRTAGNAAAAAQGNLARWTQSLNNNRRLEAGGNALGANTVNALRRRDAGIVQSFSDQIREAEQIGTQAAMAAASGVSGNVVDVINSTTALRNSIVREQTKQFEGMAQWDSLQRAAGIVQQTVSSLDNSLILDALDYNTDVGKVFSSKSNFQAGFSGALNAGVQMLGKGINPFEGAGSLWSGIKETASSWGSGGIPASTSRYALTTTGANFGMSTGKPAPYLLR